MKDVIHLQTLAIFICVIRQLQVFCLTCDTVYHWTCLYNCTDKIFILDSAGLMLTPLFLFICTKLKEAPLSVLNLDWRAPRHVQGPGPAPAALSESDECDRVRQSDRSAVRQ